MGTGLFVNVKRGGTFASAEIESLTSDELQDLLRRATPRQLCAWCALLVEWVKIRQRSEDAAPLVDKVKSSLKK